VASKLLLSDEISLPRDFVIERIAFVGRSAQTDARQTLEVRDLLFLDRGQPAAEPEHPVAPSSEKPSTLTLAELEREHILRVLHHCSGNRERAATVLGISTRTLYRKLREFDSAETR
jgi:DNA-binding NtrC family response regulator